MAVSNFNLPGRHALIFSLLLSGCAGAPEESRQRGPGDSAPSPAPQATLRNSETQFPGDLDGEALFLANCAECHQRNGRGIANVYPALDGSEVVRGSGIDVALVLRIGRGEMPSFRGALSPGEMAAVINYVRNAWSNRGEFIDADDIMALD